MATTHHANGGESCHRVDEGGDDAELPSLGVQKPPLVGGALPPMAPAGSPGTPKPHTYVAVHQDIEADAEGLGEGAALGAVLPAVVPGVPAWGGGGVQGAGAVPGCAHMCDTRVPMRQRLPYLKL